MTDHEKTEQQAEIIAQLVAKSARAIAEFSDIPNGVIGALPDQFVIAFGNLTQATQKALDAFTDPPIKFDHSELLPFRCPACGMMDHRQGECTEK